ncbi:MAG: hypothetical protein ACO1OB_02175 [Archangium sp.]
MRRWLAIASLLPCLAFAEWRQLGTITGTPADVVVVDGGVVVASLTGANGAAIAWLPLADGGVQQLASLSGANGYVGAGFDGQCLSALTPASALEFSPGCGTTTSIGVNSAAAYRSLGARGVAITFNGSLAQFVSAPDMTTTWSAQPPSFTQQASSRGLGLVNIGGIDFATTAASGVPGIRVSVDGGAPFSVAGAPVCIDVAPFDFNGAPAAIAVTNVNALVLVPDVRAAVVRSPGLPSGLLARRVAMAGAAGFVSTTTGVALSPIPDPANVGMNWVPRGTGPSLDGRVHCLDARSCAALLSTGAIWFYDNVHAPEFEITGTTMVPGVPTHFSVDAGDDDADPVFVSWSSAGAVITNDGGTPNGSSVDITFPAGSCSAMLEVSVRDALFSTTQQLNVSSEARGAIELRGPTSAIAGGPPASFAASIDGGCVSAAFSWSTTDGGTGSGASFSFTPPASSCVPGADVIVTATATWSAGSPQTTQVSRVVTIEPWGAPEAPVFAANAVQDGGASVIWSPSNGEHVCSAAAGFPGTTLIWDAIDAGTAQAQLVDGGLRISSASSCEATRVEAVAHREVVGEAFGRRSASGTLVVDVLPSREPLDSTAAFALTATAGAGVAEGTTSLTASCLAQRSVAARISVLEGATELTTNDFATPGAWSLPIPGGCVGGTYDVLAQLLEDGQLTGAEPRQQITTSATPVEVGTLDLAEARVECGATPSTELTLQPVAGACASTDVSWRAISGPALVTTSGIGTSVPFQLVSGDLTSVGQSVELEFTVSGGGTNTKTETRSVRLVAEPFVTVVVANEKPLTQQEEGRTVVVTLTNATACAVEGLTVTLSGARLVPGSVRVGDALVAAEPIDGTLVLRNVSLPAEGATQVRVFQGPAFTGVGVDVTLNGVIVGERFVAPISRECGCSGGGGGVTTLWLLSAALLRRRKQAMTRA